MYLFNAESRGGVILSIHTQCREAKTPFRATSQSLFSTVLCYCGIKRLLCPTRTDGQQTGDIVDIGKRLTFLLLKVEQIFSCLSSINRDMNVCYGICSFNSKHLEVE